MRHLLVKNSLIINFLGLRMLKKLGLSVILMTLSLNISAETTDRIAIIDNTVAHMAQQKTTIALETQFVVSLIQKVETYFAEQLKEEYGPTKEKCLAVLRVIITSAEFDTTLEQVTDIQTRFIVEQNIDYNDIIIDPSEFPLEQKIKNELANAAFDEPTEQLFNAFYTVIAIIRGSKLLLAKLDAQENQLLAERATLQAPDQTVAQ